jgi:microcystin-dependent protein
MQTKIRAEQTNLIDTIYPVGSIYMSVSSTNPGTTFGVGTWTAWGEGRVPVGVAGSGTFNTVEKTGGAETHTLTTAQMPSHTHVLRRDVTGVEIGIGGGSLANQNSLTGSWGPTTIYQNSLGAAATGGGEAHNNLQPYITCYMWKRTE